MEEQPEKSPKKPIHSYIRYSATGFQMLATIGIFTFAGYKIDEYRGSEKLIFTALLGLIGVIASLYQVVRQLNSKK
ncbi:AtpZ/AtpI family protein [Pedobacter sp. MC2016-14]|uniref:AtpZ/AtpI family protein n=1 Tax=Pedobacter sp. MC2016-14 TaxID=2897327 RepID=UPI001E2BFE91|nr:AtpZ/AtpI family protein [Pedobacter sp. MC2016-14]MCD0486801.1 AtpZ/AtpI family protein [Pedobacter sp. MC2016-14]